MRSTIGQGWSRLALCAAMIGSAPAAWSASHDFQFVAHSGEVFVQDIDIPTSPGHYWTLGSAWLFDATSGASVFPAHTLQVGDHISISVTLDAPVVVPAGGSLSNFGLSLGWLSLDDATVFLATRFDVFHQGQAVTPDSGFTVAGGSRGFLGLGGYSTAQPFAGFSFDALLVEATVTGLAQGQLPLDTVQVLQGRYTLNYQIGNTAPVPEPAAPVLMLGGLLAGWLCRRGRRAGR